MTTPDGQRMRTYGWTPIEQVGNPLSGRSGLAYFEALRDGVLPPQPITATIGWQPVIAELGRIRLEMPVAEHLFHGGGMVHGGVLSILLDSATSGAIMTTATAGARCATAQLSVQFLAAVRESVVTLFAEGRVIHAAQDTAVAEGWVEGEDGTVHARATATVLISRP